MKAPIGRRKAASLLEFAGVFIWFTSTRSENAAEANWPQSIHRENITGDGFRVSNLMLVAKRKSAFLTISLAQASLYCIIARLSDRGVEQPGSSSGS